MLKTLQHRLRFFSKNVNKRCLQYTEKQLRELKDDFSE
jgi:hypothetical protein